MYKCPGQKWLEFILLVTSVNLIIEYFASLHYETYMLSCGDSFI